ncbi:hypothetical protein AB1Y20_011046 [Prymnesium parvum]|uniref:Peptidase M48 domain-containing protein n=1 Tax=Prymnesium parvum TaxID=97485 RepID=A0AB34IP96_PRYPA|mmetsp:Transcript_5175/g.11496  ORF Transcript_5175/g.11496 Transcript_5175/m.11496 type:complete len:326 (-) Transcript_5175:237-1214(-)
MLPRLVSESRLWRGLTHPWTRRTVRILRTGALGAGIFGAGYSYGVQSCMDDPEGMGKSILRQVLRTNANGTELLDAGQPESLLVTRIGQDLLVAARKHLSQELDETTDPAEKERLTARLRALQKPSWRFVVIDNDTVNAFVTPFLPGFVFVHRGLLKTFEHSTEQLAFVIGHELSHYVLEHGSADTALRGALSLFQLVVLVAVDPTGILALLAELGVMGHVLSLMVELPSSRQHETEADALGLQLCARSCYDPRVAIKAHERLAAVELGHGGASDIHHLVSTHPATATRIDDLQHQMPAAMALYEGNGCHARKRILLRALRLFDH